MTENIALLVVLGMLVVLIIFYTFLSFRMISVIMKLKEELRIAYDDLDDKDYYDTIESVRRSWIP